MILTLLPWHISLIIIAIILFIVLPIIIFNLVGINVLKILKKSSGQGLKNNKNFDIAFYEEGPMRPLISKGREYMDKNLKEEDVYIQAFDNIKLHGYYYENPNIKSNKFFIGFHGFKSGPRDEYAPFIKDYIEMGFNILVVDERAHHKSEGKYICLGLKERYDVKSWCDYVVDRFGKDTKILIQGISMGGASVTLASALNLPTQVIGIISDCAFTSAIEELKFQMDNVAKNVPLWMIIPPVRCYLKAFAHIDIKKASSLKAVSSSKLPILYFHGKQDQMVPVEFSEKLYRATSTRKKLVIVEDANHGESYGRNPSRYMKEVKEFFDLENL